MGGLGNQLFQYSYARALKELGYTVKLDIQTFFEEDNYKPGTTFRNYLLDKFETTIPIINLYKSRYGFLLRGFNNKYVILRIPFKLLFYFWYRCCIINYDEQSRYNPRFLSLKKSCYVSGYFQNEQYFSAIRGILKKEFRLKKDVSGNLYVNLIKSRKNKNTVAMHIRRGDYCGSGNELPPEYYKNAVDYLTNNIQGELVFFVFSDDMHYVKENITLPSQTVFVNEDHSLEDFEELMVMSECQHFIIANSSFSWWGAWLADNPQKIICAPRHWVADPHDTRDIMPDYFIKISY
jgi:hypothetical protein